MPDTAVVGPVLRTVKSTVRGEFAAMELELLLVTVSIFVAVSVAEIVATLVKLPWVAGRTRAITVIMVEAPEPTAKLPTSIVMSSLLAAMVSNADGGVVT